MPSPSPKTGNAAITVDTLNVTLGGERVLRDISTTIPLGSLTAIIGPNGSGKTTFLRALLGLIPHSGTVRYFGGNFSEAQSRMGYVPQHFDFDRTLPLTVREFLELVRRPQTSREHLAHVLDEVGLPGGIQRKRLGALSGGQLQRVLIAQAIVNRPDLLFLDEPSTGIDIAGEASLLEILSHLREDHGTTIILVSHDLGMVADVVDNAVCINRRLVCSGPPHKTLTDKRLAELYGSRARQVHHAHG